MHLEIREVCKNFGKKAVLKQVSFDLKTGDIMGVFGRNGSGKSTLMKILFGTMKAETASVLIDQKPFHPNTNIPQRVIGYLPQESFLPRDMKVRDVIALALDDGERQNRLFYSPGVSTFDNQRVGSLSMGMLKYFEFLLLAHMDHPFLLLDEPFSMIDPLYHEIIKNIIHSLAADKGILLTDHYYHNVWEVSNKNCVLTDGTLLPVESKADLATYGYLRRR